VVEICQQRCEYHARPLAVDVSAPRFEWQLASDQRDVRQNWYRIVVATDAAALTADTADLWDSGEVTSADTTQVAYAGSPLPPTTRCCWQVHAGLADGTQVASPVATFETAPVPNAWAAAAWITRRRPMDATDDHRPAPYVRRRFTVTRPARRARLYATAGGIYQAWLNGAPVAATRFAPGWTDYDKRVQFHGYDLDARLAIGDNTVGAVLTDGWFSGYVGPFDTREVWGKQPCFRALIVVEYIDGSRDVLGTDESWEAAFGPILAADLQRGESYDARRDLGDWSAAGVAGSRRWQPAVAVDGPAGVLVAAPGPLAEPVGELAPRARTEPMPGSQIVDFGANIAGHVRLRLAGPAGTIVRIRHGERLDADGCLYTENLRGARATDTVVLAGGPARVWEPTFTYHGFRYAEITGHPGPLADDDVTAVAVSAAVTGAGSFSCDHELVNRVHANINTSLRANFIEVPTDCPQRDERLGWTGDAQAFAPTALRNADLAAFYTKWLTDIDDTREPAAPLPDMAPCKILPWAVAGSPGYADAGTIVPWELYQAYGDRRVLRTAYPGMTSHVDFMHRHNPDLIVRNDRNNDYGDWLAPVDTPKDLVATAYFARSARLTADTARVLGGETEHARYAELADQVAAAFVAEYVGDDGALAADTQCAYVLALAFGLVPAERAPALARQLARVVTRDGRVTTGFMAVGHLLPTLTATGRHDLALQLMLAEEYPSWGYMVRAGATSIWERWDSWTAERGLQDPWMNSFNHVALGAVGDWFYRCLAGIQPLEPGYRRVQVAPAPPGSLRAVDATYQSIRGAVRSSWQVTADSYYLQVSLPANTTGTVRLPAVGDVYEDERPVTASAGVRDVRVDGSSTVVQVGSGSYRFTVRNAAVATSGA